MNYQKKDYHRIIRKTLWIFLSTVVFLLSCGESAEEKARRNAEEQHRLAQEDSAALKIGVMPTLDCLPLYVAKEYGLIDSSKADIRLKYFTAQMDCDTAISRKRVDLTISDVVRVERMRRNGIALDYYSSTNTDWELIANKRDSIEDIAQLEGRMVAMTRFSATDMLSSVALDSVNLTDNKVFRVQINDVNIRFQMLRNNEMNALWLTEPYAAAAKAEQHNVLMTSGDKGLQLGVIAIRDDIKKDSLRQVQIDILTRAYNAATDSINTMGIKHFSDVIAKYYHVSLSILSFLSDSISFHHVSAPKEVNINIAKKWLDVNDRPLDVDIKSGEMLRPDITNKDESIVDSKKMTSK